jgi:O-methyltransferase
MGSISYFRRLAWAWASAGARGARLPLVNGEAVASGQHEMVFPHATYSPWLTDARFQAVHERIRRHTLVDRCRCYELWQLVGQVCDRPGALIEVGVWRGGTGALIAQRAADAGIHDPTYLCDTFTGIVKTGEVDTYYSGGEHADTSEALVRELLDGLGLTNVELLAGIFPDEAGTAIADRTFRFCHIDVDVYESARDVLEWVWPRLTVGGVVVFDDYGFASCPGVTRLVEEQRDVASRLVLHNLNGHAVMIKLA